MTNVLQSDERTVAITLQNDVIKLRWLRQTPDHPDTNLEILAGHSGLRTDLSRGPFHVLLLKSRSHIIGSKRASGHAHGVEPEAHRVFALAKDEHVGHAGHALQIVANVNIEVIAHEERRIAIVGREHACAENEILRSLGDCNADLLHCIRKASECGIDAVLNVHSGEIGITAEVESGGNRADSIVSARGSNVLHALGAVYLLLQRRRYCRFHGLGASSGINGRDPHLRRCKIWKLGDGQRRYANRTGENNEQCADGGKHRAMNKKVDHKKREISLKPPRIWRQ